MSRPRVTRWIVMLTIYTVDEDSYERFCHGPYQNEEKARLQARRLVAALTNKFDTDYGKRQYTTLVLPVEAGTIRVTDYTT
jgi:hypothetical protein